MASKLSSSESTGPESEEEQTQPSTSQAHHAQDKTIYINPLTIAGDVFYKTFLRYQYKYNAMDGELYKTLLNIVDAITNFIDQNTEEIHENEKLSLVKINKTEDVHTMYMCKKCQKWLHDTEKMAHHLIDGHEKKSRRERDRVRRQNFFEKKKLEAQVQSLQNLIEKTCKITQNNNETNATSAQQPSQKNVEKKKEKKSSKKAKDSAPQPLPKKIRSHLNHNYDNFFKDSLEEADVLLQIDEYNMIERNLVEHLQASFKDEQLSVYKFGSRLCGIGTRNSDLDLFVAIGDTFNVFENRGSKKTTAIISQIRKALPKYGMWSRVTAIDKARVPIVKAVHVPTGIECDIGVSNSLGYCNTELQKYLFDLQPIARRLAIYMKKWLARSKLNDIMTTYSMNLMIIYYLQTKNILPSIETLQKDLVEKSYVGPWISNFNHASLYDLKLSPYPTKTTDFKALLKAFFEFLADFKYETYIMSSYYGRPINFYSALTEMPAHYLEYLENQDADHKLMIEKPMVVQDPLQLNHNVTKGVPKSALIKFKSFLRGSADLIEVDQTNHSAGSLQA